MDKQFIYSGFKAIFLFSFFTLFTYIGLQCEKHFGLPDNEKETYTSDFGSGADVEKYSSEQTGDLLIPSFQLKKTGRDLDNNLFSVRLKAYTVFITLLSPPPDSGFTA